MISDSPHRAVQMIAAVNRASRGAPLRCAPSGDCVATAQQGTAPVIRPGFEKEYWW